MKHLEHILHRYLSERHVFILSLIFFSIRVFFHGHWQLTGHQGKRGHHLLFHSTTSTRSQTFRQLFVTLYVWWLSYFNGTACIYQIATRWDLPPSRITTWLIDDVTIVFICLRVKWFSFFVNGIWDEKPVGSKSHRLSPLYYKRTN